MKYIKNIFLFGVGFLLCLIVVEVYLNYTEIAKTNWTILTPELGKTNKPNQNVVYYSEGFYIGEINSYGYLGPSYPKEKSDDVFRISLNGDSYVEGMHVFDRHHFRTLLEQKLNQSSKDSVEILNFGKGIFDFNDMYCYLHNYSSQFDADINLIFIHNIDFQENRDPAMPYVEVKGDTSFINTDFNKGNRFAKYEKLKPIMASPIGRLSFNCSKLIDKAPAIIFDKFYLAFNKPVKGKHPFPLEFTEQTKTIINGFAQDKKNIIVYWDYIQDDIKKYIDEAGIETIDLYPALAAENKDEYLETWVVTGEVGHFNHEGHEKVSSILFNALKSRIESKEHQH